MAKAKQDPVDDTPAVKPVKRVPPMSEGTRDELERLGTAACPFTGRKLTRDDL